MKSYYQIMVDFIGKKFGKLTSNILIRDYINRTGITNPELLPVQDQIFFSNEFIATILKKHMTEQKIGIVTADLMATYCIVNASFGFSRSISKHFEFTHSPPENKHVALAISELSDKDMIIKLDFTSPLKHNAYFLFDFDTAHKLASLLDTVEGTELGEPHYNALRNFLDNFMRETDSVYEDLMGEHLAFSFPPFSQCSELLSELRQSETSEKNIFYSDCSITIDKNEYNFKFVSIKNE